ncbi:MAG TPA: Spy/CpxP family protein refolding chaperone [Methylomirabilota bacterium]|nr:Spy/CpxP family protein refolding chaperone [Methylomirabilota bacterium]
MRSNVALSVIVAMVLWSAAAFGQDAGPSWHSRSWGGPILRSVGLSDAQKAQVRQIIANHRPQFRALRGQLQTAQSQLDDQLYGSNAVSTASLSPLAQQIAQLRTQLAQERLQVALEIRSVLTPDQQAKAAQIRLQLTQLRSQIRTLLQPAP